MNCCFCFINFTFFEPKLIYVWIWGKKLLRTIQCIILEHTFAWKNLPCAILFFEWYQCDVFDFDEVIYFSDKPKLKNFFICNRETESVLNDLFWLVTSRLEIEWNKRDKYMRPSNTILFTLFPLNWNISLTVRQSNNFSIFNWSYFTFYIQTLSMIDSQIWIFIR